MKHLIDVFKKGEKIICKKHSLLYTPTSSTKDVYYIQSGFVQTYSKLLNKNKELHMIYKRGEVFPLIWGDKRNNDFFYEAITDTVVYKLQYNTLKKIVKNNMKLQLEFLDLFSTITYVLQMRLKNLGVERAEGRLLERLIFFAQRFGEKEDKNITVNLPLTHEVIANSIGIARETTTRGLKKLQREGIIEYKNHSIIIKNYKVLQNYNNQLLK